MWWRFAFLGLFSGEMSNGGAHFNFSVPQMPSNSNHLLRPEAAYILPLVLVAGAIIIALFLAITYIASVLRFVLFDAVLSGRHRIREGWRMWRERAIPYFRLQLLLLLAFIVGIAVTAGIPVGLIWMRTGFTKARWDTDATLLAICAVLLTIGWIVCVAVASVMSKDFVLPMMALEGVGYAEGWSRLVEMLKSEKKSYAIYILMKVVLALAGAALLGIAILLALLAIGIPLAAIGAVVYVAFKAAFAGTVGKWILVGICVLVAMLLLFPAIMLLTAPLAVFYPAYSMFFFAGRYAPLYAALYPAPPPETPAV